MPATKLSGNAMPTAKDWMTPPRLTLPPEMPIADAIDQLVERQVSTLMVVHGKTAKLVGILTDKDCLRVLSRAIYDEHVTPAKVADYMSEVKVTIGPDMDMFAIAEQFLSCHFQTLPVVEDGVLLGRIGRKDLLQGIQAFLAAKAEEQQKMLTASHRRERPRSIEDMQRAAAKESRETLAQRFTRNR
ncbi:MAG: CBS domain-containing protein [Acidobacteria bacterium]|nr:CBS domain-containing protein [Acidobacteriota bacterium]